MPSTERYIEEMGIAHIRVRMNEELGIAQCRVRVDP